MKDIWNWKKTHVWANGIGKNVRCFPLTIGILKTWKLLDLWLLVYGVCKLFITSRKYSTYWRITSIRPFFNRAVETCNFDPLTLIQFTNGFLHLTAWFFSIKYIGVPKPYIPPSHFSNFWSLHFRILVPIRSWSLQQCGLLYKEKLYKF